MPGHLAQFAAILLLSAMLLSQNLLAAQFLRAVASPIDEIYDSSSYDSQQAGSRLTIPTQMLVIIAFLAALCAS